jgi:hypothetical protein
VINQVFTRNERASVGGLGSTMVVHLDGNQEPGPGSGRVRKLLSDFKFPIWVSFKGGGPIETSYRKIFFSKSALPFKANFDSHFTVKFCLKNSFNFLFSMKINTNAKILNNF